MNTVYFGKVKVHLYFLNSEKVFNTSFADDYLL